MRVIGVHVDGGMTEYLSVPSSILIKSQGLPVDTLALIEPLAVSSHGIARAGIKKGDFVMIFGAGPIGLGAMAFAMVAGAQVIAVDINESRLRFCKSVLKVPFTLNGRDPNLLDQVKEITNNDLPSTVIDATGNLSSINRGFQFMAHGGKYVLIGLQKENISISHPDFHKKEGTLMSSRNATRGDFEFVLDCIGKGFLDPTIFITNRVAFGDVKKVFLELTRGGNVIKAVVEMD